MKITNKSAYFEYNILDTYEAGVVLTGAEAKAIHGGRVKLDAAYVRIIDGKPQLINAVIPTYEFAHDDKYHPDRTRPLLLKKAEILKLTQKLLTKGLTLIPVSMYTKKNLVKVQIGLAKGKQAFEKRAAIKKKDSDRELRRDYKLR